MDLRVDTGVGLTVQASSTKFPWAPYVLCTMAKHSCWDRPAFRRGVRRNSCSHGAAVFALAALGTLAGASAARCGSDLDLLCVDFESNAARGAALIRRRSVTLVRR